MSNQKLIPNYESDKNQLVEQLKGMLPDEQFQIFNDDATALSNDILNPLAINTGDLAPYFSLPNATGTIIHSKDLLRKGAVVLTFYRGEWCPYCNLYLKQLQSVLPEIEAANATLVAISPQQPDHSLSMKEKNELKFHLLTDIENQVAKQFTTIFKYGDKPVKAMSDLGYDFDSFYLDKRRELPVPATFIIKQNGLVSFAQSEGGDYRLRVEIATILKSL